MKVIMGEINANNKIRYWNIGEKYTPDVAVNDYAIVKNKKDFDLIKIIGIVETTEEYAIEFNFGDQIEEVVDYVSAIVFDKFKESKKR